MFSEVFTVSVFGLSLALLLLVLCRKLSRCLLAFTVFVVMLVVRDAACLIVAHASLNHSVAWSYTYWTSELILSAMYLAMIAEISKRFLSEYPSIWHSSSRLLAVVGVALMSWMASSMIHYARHPRMFYMVGDQRLELSISILLLLLMGIGTYYRLKIPPLYRLVLIGIGIYASVQVAANQIEIQFKMGSESLFDYMRRGSFTISLIVWIYAVWRWATPAATQPELIPQSKYDDLSQQVHNRLQDVNFKLAKLASQRL